MNEENKSRYSLQTLMPQDDESKRILKERADDLALSHTKIEPVGESQHYVCFKLGNFERYGLPYHAIKEVLLNVVPTPVPNTPAWVAGIMNRHGLLLAIIDLKPFFHITSESRDSISHLIVVNAKGITCAILVDAIEGSDTYNPKNLEASLVADGAINPKYVIGLHQGLTAILNIEALIADLHFNQSAPQEKKQWNL